MSLADASASDGGSSDGGSSDGGGFDSSSSDDGGGGGGRAGVPRWGLAPPRERRRGEAADLAHSVVDPHAEALILARAAASSSSSCSSLASAAAVASAAAGGTAAALGAAKGARGKHAHRAARSGNAKLARRGVGDERFVVAGPAAAPAAEARAAKAAAAEAGSLAYPAPPRFGGAGSFSSSSASSWSGLLALPGPEGRAHQAALARRREGLARQCFGPWKALLLRGGFNLLLYGFGSKRRLLDAFRREALQGTIVVELDGAEPGARVEHVLEALAGGLLGRGDELRHPDPEVFAANIAAWLGPHRPRTTGASAGGGGASVAAAAAAAGAPRGASRRQRGRGLG